MKVRDAIGFLSCAQWHAYPVGKAEPTLQSAAHPNMKPAGESPGRVGHVAEPARLHVRLQMAAEYANSEQDASAEERPDLGLFAAAARPLSRAAPPAAPAAARWRVAGWRLGGR